MNVYGFPPEDLVGSLAGARQFSPLSPGAEPLETVAPQSLDDFVLLGPPGTIERRAVIALALRALQPGATLTVLAPKDKGGSRLASDLETLGCTFDERSKRHHRICVTSGPGDAGALDKAIDDGKPRFVEELGLWSQPGVFSWNRIDPGSALLLDHLPPLSGKGADLGCGLGVLAHAVLTSPKVSQLALVDIDRRAVDLARRNVVDPRVRFLWADARKTSELQGLDFIVMNPPFHEGGHEDQSLGQAFIQAAAKMLRKGGMLWLTANRHLPYERILKPSFKRVELVAEAGGYKIYRAQA
jgi:16S rRNA (guanine1207-N2)-methyltransferase